MITRAEAGGRVRGHTLNLVKPRDGKALMLMTICGRTREDASCAARSAGANPFCRRSAPLMARSQRLKETDLAMGGPKRWLWPRTAFFPAASVISFPGLERSKPRDQRRVDRAGVLNEHTLVPGSWRRCTPLGPEIALSRHQEFAGLDFLAGVACLRARASGSLTVREVVCAVWEKTWEQTVERKNKSASGGRKHASRHTDRRDERRPPGAGRQMRRRPANGTVESDDGDGVWNRHAGLAQDTRG